ncbi:MAG: GNAT family N-acetyltransferase [Defluviitaleaceae bacterium]|nr:GNAT family N-acetyltransferase [Defluviitaleaceae bacterium]
MDYKLTTNNLCAKDFIRLRESAGWGNPLLEHQVAAGLENSLITVEAICDGQVVGMGRLVGDGFTIFYIQDVIVLPKFQGHGVGTTIMQRLIAHISDSALPGTRVATGLFSVKGKEGFYKKFGFCARPDDTGGAGMLMRVESRGCHSEINEKRSGQSGT